MKCPLDPPKAARQKPLESPFASGAASEDEEDGFAGGGAHGVNGLYGFWSLSVLAPEGRSGVYRTTIGASARITCKNP